MFARRPTGRPTYLVIAAAARVGTSADRQAGVVGREPDGPDRAAEEGGGDQDEEERPAHERHLLSYFACALRNAGWMPAALRSAAGRRAARPRARAGRASRCRAMVFVTAGGRARRTAPAVPTTSRKTLSPRSCCR